MSNMERTTSWQQIQLGVKEAERLIVRKEYNLVMVKARPVSYTHLDVYKRQVQ